MGRNDKCIACKRPVDIFPQTQRMGTGPVCIPCFWAAKLKYEQGITDVSQIDEQMAFLLMGNFHRSNCSWPFDLIDRWQNIDFERIASKLQNWWFVSSRVINQG